MNVRVPSARARIVLPSLAARTLPAREPPRRPGPVPEGRSRFAALLALVVACLAGCATLPDNTGRVPSTALTSSGTPLGRVAAASLDGSRSDRATAEVSGFQLVAAGEEAFGTLYTLIARAERSLDLQYYIVADDPYARTLLRAARQAAGRGVRVRLLVDDFYTTGKDARIAWYAHHPNIEVRVFNPFAGGRAWFATRLMTSLADIGRINRRMHNKLFVADNAFAITGGRNIGAEYYQHSDRTNFLDLDVLATGPIVADLSETFDRYWNSGFAYPIETLAGASTAPEDTPDERALLDPNDPVRAATDEARQLGATFAARVDSGRIAMTAAPAALLADRPSKVGRSRPRLAPGGLVAGETIATDLLSVIDTAESELIVISPYFVPGARGMAAFKRLVDRGVKVKILTNSLAATDAAIVHIGYSKYRKQLLADGVEVYELRPDSGEERANLGVIGSSKASLHAKVQVIDRKTIFIGSFNVDPRSSLENTEMGLDIESPTLATQVTDILRDRGEEGRYRVTLDEDGSLVWTTRTKGVLQVFHDEPGAGTLLKWSLRLLAPFAPEQML